METATFGAGCFWGIEEKFRTTKGVISTAAGYSGGKTENPTYEQVCSGRTGHAEVVQVTYDPSVVSYGDLLALFWRIHDPTTPNRQGPDIGDQYRSIILCSDRLQMNAAIASRLEADRSGAFRRPIVTEIAMLERFYRAEEYHQQYILKTKGASCHRR